MVFGFADTHARMLCKSSPNHFGKLSFLSLESWFDMLEVYLINFLQFVGQGSRGDRSLVLSHEM